MKVFVTRSSKWTRDGEVREYENLETCIKTLLETEDYGKWKPQLVISTIDQLIPDFGQDCEYEIEIYDTWRE